MRWKWLALCAFACCAAGISAQPQEPTHHLDLVNAVRTTDAEYAAIVNELALLNSVPPRPTITDGPVPPPLPLAVRLESFDSGTYDVGDDIVYEVVISNTGSSSLYLPTSSQVHRFTREMPGAVQSVFSLQFSDDVLGDVVCAVWATYGSSSVAGTLLQVGPGESVAVRVKGSLSFQTPAGAPTAWLRVVNARAVFGIYPVTGEPYGQVISANHIPVQITNSP